MKTNVFCRLFSAAILTMAVWSAISLDVYGYMNDSSSGGTLLDVFRGRSSASNSAQTAVTPTPAPAPALAPAPPLMPAPQMTNVPAQQQSGTRQEPAVVRREISGNSYPSSPIIDSEPYPVAPAPEPQPVTKSKWSFKAWLTGAAPNEPQYAEPMPTTPAPTYNAPHASRPAAPKAQNTQYRVVPLDSDDFRPQEGAIYNEKGEMIYNPKSGEPMPKFDDREMVYDDNNGLEPYNIPETKPKRSIIEAPEGAGRPSTAVNQERVYTQQQPYPGGAQQIPPAQAPVNPYAQQPSVSAGNPPVGSGKSILSDNSGSLKLESGSTAFSKTYKPIPRVTNVPPEPVMDMTGPALPNASPQKATPSPAVAKNTAAPQRNLSERNSQAPALQPVPKADVKERTAVPQKQPTQKAPVVSQPTVKRESAPKPADSASKVKTPVQTAQTAQPPADKQKKPETRQQTSAEPMIVGIAGPKEVEFGKNEMFSLSVTNTTDAIRRDVVLSVHPEGFGDDKTASITIPRLLPGEKKSVYMKLNARQYNNLSLTAQASDALGYQTKKRININVKNELVKISILPPQTGDAFVGQPTQYLVRIVNKSPKTVSLNAIAFFGNGIEPIRAVGAPNSIQSGQVVVNDPVNLKQGEMRDLKIVAIAFQPGVHKILVHLIDSNGAIYAAKESCAYRQRESEDDTELVENDPHIELTPGKSEMGVWKPASASPSPAVGNRQETVESIALPSAQPDNRQETVEKSEDRRQETVENRTSPETNSTPLATRNSQLATPGAPSFHAPDAVPLTQPDQQDELIMPMFEQ